MYYITISAIAKIANQYSVYCYMDLGSSRQLPRPEGRSLQLYSLNPYEINTRYIGHQERVSWPSPLTR
jgi:hypothetical protein